MDVDQPTPTDQPGVPVPVPFRPGRIAICPLCGLDLTARTVHYIRGLGVCLACCTHAHPAQLRRYVRSFMHHARRSDQSVYRGMTFWLPACPLGDDNLPSWIGHVPKSDRILLLSRPLINPDWVARDLAFDAARRTAAIGAICRDLADERGHAVGGYEPRFKPISKPDQADSLRRQVQQMLGFT